jgi:hypothetical protein
MSICLTYFLTPWSTVLLEKLTGLQLVKKFPAFHGTRSFIAAFTTACHLSLSWASSIPTSHFLKICLNIIFPSTSGVYQLVSFTKFFLPKPRTCLFSPRTRYMPRPSHYSRFNDMHNNGWSIHLNITLQKLVNNRTIKFSVRTSSENTHF